MAALTTTLSALLHSPSRSRSPAVARFPSSSSHSISFINSSSSSFISSNFNSHVSLIATRSSRASSGFYTKASATAEKKKVLIVNTNSGAHVIIGFFFAKQLLGAGHDVTFFIVGEEGSDKMKKTPFTRLPELTSVGGKTVWGEPADIAKIIGDGGFDVVLENNAKDLENFKPVADWAKSTGVKQFLYISSAGIYIPTDEVPHVEGDPVKGDAGHIFAEKYLAELSFPTWSIFRPQYITGSGNNKDCEEWFFNRIVRDRPVPIPGSGLTLTNIAHVKDLSSMLSLAIENPDAANTKLFNCVSDRAVTLNGFAKLCAQAAGREIKIVNYDPKALGIDPKKAFPFRIMHFYAEPRAAKEILGWNGTTNLPEDLKKRFDEYVELGRDTKSLKFDLDDKILESLKVPVSV